MICPYSFDEPIGSGIPALLDGRYWCMGHIALGMSARRRRCPEDCPYDFGEWGAWRAVLDEVSRCACAMVAYLSVRNEFDAHWAAVDLEWYLSAVGWSP